MKKDILNLLLVGLFLFSAGACFMAPVQVVAADNITKEQPIVSQATEVRTENTRTTSTDGLTYTLESSISPLFYKDNYKDPNEPWKDIDTTIVNNQITKAPYTLVIDPTNKKVTITDKKTGESTSLGLEGLKDSTDKVLPVGLTSSVTSANTVTWTDIALDTDLVISAESSQVKFQRILKTDKAAAEATFSLVNITKIGVPLKVSAFNSDGLSVPVDYSIVGTTLTESVDLKDQKFPVTVDPLFNVAVAASADDVLYRKTTVYFDYTLVFNAIGSYNATYYRYGSGMRFRNITVPQGANILSAYITLYSNGSQTSTTAKAKLSLYDADDSTAFSNQADFDTKFASITGQVSWTMGNWPASPGTVDSPSLLTGVQNVINRGGWASGNSMIVFWEDFSAESTTGTMRQAHSYDSSSSYAPRITIRYLLDGEVAVSAATDDCSRRLTTSWFGLTETYLIAGEYNSSNYQYGTGMRFQNIQVPQGATILSANITFICHTSATGTTVNTRLSVEDADDTATFSTSGDFDARYANVTGTVSWDNIPAWTAESVYVSPSIVTGVQNVVNRGGWTSGNNMTVFWEDFEDRSTHGTIVMRYAHSYESDPYKAPVLYILYSAGTAEGEVAPDTHGFGLLEAGTTSETGLDTFTLTSTGGLSIDVTIGGSDLTGGDTWTLSDTCEPGENIYGLMAGLYGGSYNIIVRKTGPYNLLIEDLSTTQDFGLKFYAPSSFTDPLDLDEKTGIITLTVSAH